MEPRMTLCNSENKLLLAPFWVIITADYASRPVTVSRRILKGISRCIVVYPSRFTPLRETGYEATTHRTLLYCTGPFDPYPSHPLHPTRPYISLP